MTPSSASLAGPFVTCKQREAREDQTGFCTSVCSGSPCLNGAQVWDQHCRNPREDLSASALLATLPRSLPFSAVRPHTVITKFSGPEDRAGRCRVYGSLRTRLARRRPLRNSPDEHR